MINAKQRPQEDINISKEEDEAIYDDSSDDGLYGDDLGYNDFYDGGGVAPIEKHKDLLKELTDFSPIIQDIVNGWLGRVWNPSTEKFEHDDSIPAIMNTQCALWCIGFLKTYARKTNIITNIGLEEYNNLHLDIIRVIWLGVATRDDFGIKSTSDLYRICTELEHSAILVLMGAGDGKYTKFLGESVNRTENVSYNGQQPNGIVTQQQKPKNMLAKIKQGLFGRR